MGSVTGAIQETIDKLCKEGKKVGFIQVHLYRPFSLEHFMKLCLTRSARLPSWTARRNRVL